MDIVKKAHLVNNSAEVQNAIKALSKYGLGVCIPHKHDDETGAFRELPEDEVQLESQFKIRFVSREDLTENDLPVAWVWDDDLKVVQACAVCRADGPHH